jgi:protein-glutamine gamma-glutamyltransferase
LVYLQIIQFFQEKTQRVYWWQAVMSLLQVMVAAGLSEGIWFGLLLAVYVMVGLCGLTLLMLYSESERHASSQGTGTSPRSEPVPRPTAGEAAQFIPGVAGTNRAGLVGELFARLGMFGMGTLVLSMVIFFTVPRVGGPAWRSAAPALRRVVGFSDQVRLGEMGEILESREEVMRIELTQAGKPYPVQEELYLRGTVATHYANNLWQSGERLLWTMPPPRPATKAVTQRIIVEPLDRDELFSIWPPVLPLDKNRDSKYVTYDEPTERLLRSSEARGRRFNFRVRTSGMADGRQIDLTPCGRPVDRAALLQLGKFPRLRGLAKQWLAESQCPAERHYECARLLERQLAASGRFQYSLQGQERDLGIDAIEDFVSNNPRGHCEYFATTLALMLRSVGIPARLVLGYRCDEWNGLGKFYQVRQLHAHAWVEAYLAPGQIPSAAGDCPDFRRAARSAAAKMGLSPVAAAGDDPRRWAFGGWLRLEPTPAAQLGTLAADGSSWGQWQRRYHRLQSAWENYIVEMDRQRQTAAVYQPLLRAVQAALRTLRDPQWWAGIVRRLAAAMGLTSLYGSMGWLRAALALTAGAAVLGGACWASWLAGRAAWRRMFRRDDAAAARQPSRVDFYRRMEHLLARRGMVRGATQTPREFARRAGAELARRSGRVELAAAPLAVVEAFYRVRFGRERLAEADRAAVASGLGMIAET